MKGLGSIEFATALRDVVRKFVRQELDEQRPRARVGIVQAVDADGRGATIVYEEEQDDGDPISVMLPVGFEPSSLEDGQRVRVEGSSGARVITAVLDGPSDIAITANEAGFALVRFHQPVDTDAEGNPPAEPAKIVSSVDPEATEPNILALASPVYEGDTQWAMVGVEGVDGTGAKAFLEASDDVQIDAPAVRIAPNGGVISVHNIKLLEPPMIVVQGPTYTFGSAVDTVLPLDTLVMRNDFADGSVAMAYDFTGHTLRPLLAGRYEMTCNISNNDPAGPTWGFTGYRLGNVPGGGLMTEEMNVSDNHGGVLGTRYTWTTTRAFNGVDDYLQIRGFIRVGGEFRVRRLSLRLVSF